jgi:hypothetical protein
VFKGPVAWTGKTTETGLIATDCNRTSGCGFHRSYPFAVAGSGLSLNGGKPVKTGCHQLQPVFLVILSTYGSIAHITLIPDTITTLRHNASVPRNYYNNVANQN